jgi:hypothetical protein
VETWSVEPSAWLDSRWFTNSQFSLNQSSFVDVIHLVALVASPLMATVNVDPEDWRAPPHPPSPFRALLLSRGEPPWPVWEHPDRSAPPYGTAGLCPIMIRHEAELQL